MESGAIEVGGNMQPFTKDRNFVLNPVLTAVVEVDDEENKMARSSLAYRVYAAPKNSCAYVAIWNPVRMARNCMYTLHGATSQRRQRRTLYVT